MCEMWETEYDQADSYERIFESDSLSDWIDLKCYFNSGKILKCDQKDWFLWIDHSYGAIIELVKNKLV